MMKKRLGILLSCLLVGTLVLTGCSSGKKGAANFVKKYYQDWIDGKMTAESSYDYVSDQSKELLGLTKEDYVANLEATTEELNLEYTDITIVGEESMDEGIYRIRRTYKTDTILGDNESETGYDYVVKENGEYKFLLYGAYESAELSPFYPKSGQLNIGATKAYTSVDGLVLQMEVSNLSANHYSIGYMGDGEIQVITDKGEFTETVDGSVRMLASGTRTGEFKISGAKGSVQKIIINNIYALGDNLVPIDTQNSFSVTIYDVE